MQRAIFAWNKVIVFARALIVVAAAAAFVEPAPGIPSIFRKNEADALPSGI